MSNKMALDALKFYADPGDYKAPFTGGMGKLYFDCGEKARAAIAALQAEPQGWMPIETAPKQGRILVWNPYFGVYSSEYTIERGYTGPDDMRPASEVPIKWAGYPLGLTNTGFGKWFPTATQWTTLPTPPKD